MGRVRAGRVLAAGLAMLAAASLAQQTTELRRTLFAAADAALEQARAADAELLSPTHFERAMSHYRDAESRLERGSNLDRIRRELAAAAADFARAQEVAGLARQALGPLIEARHDAAEAQAASHVAELWSRAEREFRRAAIAVEDGDLRLAERRRNAAEPLYRQAELVAIKAHYLNDTRALLVRADAERVSRYAPRTLARARELLEAAERELNQNRYDTDLPRSLAQQANYEARHAMHLAETVRALEESDGTMEDLILEWQTPLRRIAASGDLVALFDEGHEAPADAVVAYIESLQGRNRELEQTIGDQQQQIATLREDLGGIVEQRKALAERIKAQTRMREQVAQIEQMFGREEAQVFREGEAIFIRLIGLSFPVGQASIEQQSYELLGKLQQAVAIFPGATVVVEGHTDSYGGDQANYVLSQQRADAVRQYLIANMGLPAEGVSAVGYGETRPVANNETVAGRARNRRIDVVIRPPAG